MIKECTQLTVYEVHPAKTNAVEYNKTSDLHDVDNVQFLLKLFQRGVDFP